MCTGLNLQKGHRYLARSHCLPHLYTISTNQGRPFSDFMAGDVAVAHMAESPTNLNKKHQQKYQDFLKTNMQLPFISLISHFMVFYGFLCILWTFFLSSNRHLAMTFPSRPDHLKPGHSIHRHHIHEVRKLRGGQVQGTFPEIDHFVGLRCHVEPPDLMIIW